jgi:hypothetical protein
MLDTERQALIRQYGEGVPALKTAVATVPAPAMQWRPGPGAWSVHEIVCHCADSETNSASRIRYLTGEKDLTDAWDRAHHHKTKDAYTATDWLRTYAVHLHEHARQVADNVAAWRARKAS